ncbi:MAG: hypothetical protein DBX66_04825 [Clostridiales bacterium]|nr:MAG: hypothetical protein DBX66_04825 [Clostridiales bacterium]RGB65716.1 hypothetical protein DW086_09860 [Harryflintia acetispora]
MVSLAEKTELVKYREKVSEMEEKLQVVCAGHAVVDVLLDTVRPPMLEHDGPLRDASLAPGGDALNEALALRRLGVSVGFLGQLGEDLGGELLLTLLRRAGVDVGAVRRGGRTTLSAVNLLPGGEHRFWSFQSGGNALQADMLDEGMIARAKVFCIGSLMPHSGMDFPGLGEVCRRARAQGVLTAADAVLPPGDYDQNEMTAQLLPVIRQLDWFLPSIGEASVLTGEREPRLAARALQAAGARGVVLKLGARGCLLAAGGRELMVPAYPVPVVDTVGAGDNFVAGFLAGLSFGWSDRQCARLAAAAGALSTTAHGAAGGLKDLEQAMKLMKGSNEDETGNAF